MNKSRRKYDAKRAEVVKFLANKFNCTPEYIRSVIHPDSTVSWLRSDEIRREYKEKYEAIRNILS